MLASPCQFQSSVVFPEFAGVSPFTLSFPCIQHWFCLASFMLHFSSLLHNRSGSNRSAFIEPAYARMALGLPSYSRVEATWTEAQDMSVSLHAKQRAMDHLLRMSESYSCSSLCDAIPIRQDSS